MRWETRDGKNPSNFSFSYHSSLRSNLSLEHFVPPSDNGKWHYLQTNKTLSHSTSTIGSFDIYLVITFNKNFENFENDPWDMLNNFCFHVYAQKSLFIVENVIGFFWDVDVDASSTTV